MTRAVASILLAALAVALLATTGRAADERSRLASAESRLVPADAPEMRYEGRFDTRDPLRPVLIWESSRIRVDFDGERLALAFEEARGQNAFDVTVDGTTRVVAVPTGAGPAGAGARGSGPYRAYWTRLGSGRHRLTLTKRTESLVGTVRFLGVELAASAHVFPPADPGYRLRMEFIGDSITAGACDEDGAVDQWENRLTHNSAKSYAALTAAAFAADHRNISVSGMGVSTGYVDIRAGEVWDRLYPRTTEPWTSDSKTTLPHLAGPRADAAAWVPDVVFVNLGENDQSFTVGQRQPFPPDFVERYLALVAAIRATYPASQIVLLRGGMGGGAQGSDLPRAWDAVVARATATDAKVHSYVFGHWSVQHPRVDDHRALADELVAWLTWQDFMRPWSVRTTGGR